MKRLVARVAPWPARRPRLALALCAVAAAAALLGLFDPSDGRLRLRVDPALDELLPEEDAGRRHYRVLQERFGGDEQLLVAAPLPDLFSAPTLERVDRLVRRLEARSWVQRVTAVTNAPHVRSQDGELRLEPLLDRVPRDQRSLEELRETVLSHPVHAGTLVSRDGSVAAFLVQLEPMSEQAFIEQRLDERLERTARDTLGVGTVWVAGTPAVKASMSRILLRDLLTLVPAVLVVMVVFSWWVFRGAAGAVVPVATILLALLWTLGAMAALGHALNVITSLVPPLVLVIGFAYAVHLVSGWRAALTQAGPGGAPAAERALAEVAFPVSLTALTTAAGFLSLGVNSLEVIRGFGFFAALGVAASLLSALIFAPALLAVLPLPRREREDRAGRRFERAARRLARFDLRHRRAVLLGAGAVALASVALATRIEVDTEVVENFDRDAPVRRSMEAVNRHLDGASTFSVVLEGEARGAFKEPRNLRAVAGLQQDLEAMPGVGGTTSLVDHLTLLNRAFTGRPEAGLPDSRRFVAQLLFLGGNEQLDRFVDGAQRQAVVAVRSPLSSSREIGELVDRVRRRLESLPEGLTGGVTGNAVLLTRAADEISRGQARSLATAFAAIGAILVLYFASLRLGLLALVPNALPVIVYFGALGLTGVTLNNATALMGCIVLGIAVDDTIHFLVHFRREARRRGGAGAGAVEALARVARPVTHTTLVLCLGLSLLAFSELRTQAQFGWLGAFTLAVAWVVDVLVTPALCSLLHPVLDDSAGAAPDRSPAPRRGRAPRMRREETLPRGGRARSR